MSENVPFKEIKEVDTKLSELSFEYWLHEDLFSPQWWFLLIIIILPWLIFLRIFIHKQKTEILLYGTLIMVFISSLDDLGLELQLWSYKHRLTFLPRLNPVNYSLLPVTYMIMYDYFQKWSSFTIVICCFSLIGAFIIEPFFIWLDIYQLQAWKHYYSIPFYIAIPLFFKWLVIKIGSGAKQ